MESADFDRVPKERMQRSADRTSPAGEVVVVLVTAFGYLVLMSLAMAAGGRFVTGYKLDNAGAAGLILYELVALAIVGTFLKSRGWTLRDFNPEISWRLTGAGVLLAAAILAANWILAALFMAVGLIGAEAYGSVDAGGLGVALFTALCIVNPVFEETLVVGYVAEALRDRRPPLLAVNLSVSIRLLYHLYQGPAGVIAVVPAGLLFAFAYQRWNRLWPLVFAHSLLDALGILNSR